jgi:hypothetical protein
MKVWSLPITASRLALFKDQHYLLSTTDDSRVAEAGGNRVKGEKYKREAEMMLKQDWTLIFPDEQPPELEGTDAGESV